MTQPRHPRRSVALLLFLGLVALLQAAPVKFDIPAQPAPAAIELFIKQSATRVAYVESDLSDITANAVVGEYEPAEALARLLKGTPCTISERRAGWFSVVRQPAENPGFVDGSVRDETGRPLSGVRITLVGAEIGATTDRRGRFSLSGVPAGEHVLHVTAEGIQNTRVTDVNVRSGHRLTLSPITVPAKTAGLVQLEDYVVSAKRSDGTIELDPYDVYGNRVKPFSTANLDLTRTRDDALPFLTFSTRDIELSGALNLQEFFRARLAQDFSTAIPGQGFGDANAPTLMGNTIDMRGWGAQETVILLNGRRMPGRYAGNSSDGNFSLADFTTIPMSAIERIEILPAAGSAIYGANATGGVINIITRRDYRGGQLAFSYESPADTHAPRYSAEVNYGMPISDKLHIRFSAGYQRYNPLEVGDRAEQTTLRWYRFLQARDPSRLVTPLAANPRNTTSLLLHGTPNIRTVAVNANSNLFGPGTPNYTSVPAGYAGGQGIQPFLARQGQYSFEMGPGALSAQWGSNAWRGAASESKSATMGIDYVLSDKWRLSLEAVYQSNLSLGIGNYAATHSGSIIVPASAPTNPFGQAVYVEFDDPRMNRPELQRYFHTEKTQVSVNLQGELGEWRGYVDLAVSRDTEKFESDNFNSPWGGWQEAFNSGAYNPFVDMRTVAPALSSFYDRYVSLQFDLGGATRFYQAMLRASGPVFELPAGPIQLTLGGEWTLSDRYHAYSRSGWFDSQTGNPAPLFPGESARFISNPNPTRFFKITESAAYAEANVPVVAPKQKWMGLERFDVFVSGRVNERVINGFRANGTAVTGRTQPYVHAVGARIDPLAGVTIRASQSIGFKPPTLGSSRILVGSRVVGPDAPLASGLAAVAWRGEHRC